MLQHGNFTRYSMATLNDKVITMKNILWVLLGLFILPLPGFAAGQSTILEVEGFGLTRSQAVQNGLIEAVKQAKGVSIDSQKAFARMIREKSVSKNGNNTHKIQVSKENQSLVMEATQGLIHGYQILDSTKTQEGDWRVALEVTLLRYKTPGISPQSRRKIAILPFSTIKSDHDFGQGPVPAVEIAREFTQNLVTQMTQTRKFTVLDREYMETFLREKRLILSADAPVSEQMIIGEVLGVDYLLMGAISKADYEQIPYTIQATGERGYDSKATFMADYRIVVMATRQIKWSDSVAMTLENTQIEEMVANSAAGQVRQALLEKAAQNIIHGAMDNIYPLRVVQVQPDGKIILNQGGVTLSRGQTLEVFSPGEKVQDSYTGESLGAAESWIATIEIDRVIPKMSYARVIKGQALAVKNGSICRRTQAKSKDAVEKILAGRKTDIQSTSTGGVILPFD